MRKRQECLRFCWPTGFWMASDEPKPKNTMAAPDRPDWSDVPPRRVTLYYHSTRITARAVDAFLWFFSVLRFVLLIQLRRSFANNEYNNHNEWMNNGDTNLKLIRNKKLVTMFKSHQLLQRVEGDVQKKRNFRVRKGKSHSQPEVGGLLTTVRPTASICGDQIRSGGMLACPLRTSRTCVKCFLRGWLHKKEFRLHSATSGCVSFRFSWTFLLCFYQPRNLGRVRESPCLSLFL